MSSREDAATDFWLTAMSCKAGAQTMAGKIGKAIATDKTQQREDLIASALKQARMIVDGLERLSSQAADPNDANLGAA